MFDREKQGDWNENKRSYDIKRVRKELRHIYKYERIITLDGLNLLRLRHLPP